MSSIATNLSLPGSPGVASEQIPPMEAACGYGCVLYVVLFVLVALLMRKLGII